MRRRSMDVLVGLFLLTLFISITLCPSLAFAGDNQGLEDPMVAGASTRWYLAEGSTGSSAQGGFFTHIFLQNPGSEAATANLTYQTPDGKIAGPEVNVEPQSTVWVMVDVPNCWSVSTMVESDKPITAGREMTWWVPDPNADPWEEPNKTLAAHYSIGVTGAQTRWYLAEGSTGINPEGNFETWVMVQNPVATQANIQLYYQTPGGEVKGQSATLLPYSRQSWSVGEILNNEWSVSTKVASDKPVIAERAVYWNTPGLQRQCAHDSIGVPDPSNEWYLAEGSTGSSPEGFFETWICVQNPSLSNSANVQVEYQTPSGKVGGPALTLSPGTRQSVSVSDKVANQFSVSTKVTSDKPIVAERSMYWTSWKNGADAEYRTSAHDSIGATAPEDTWYLPGGFTFSSEIVQYESWVTIQNPNNQPAAIDMIYTTDEGPEQGPSETIPANSRKTYKVNDVVGPYSTCTGVIVRTTSTVVAENSIYGNSSRTFGMDSIGIPSY